MNVRINGKDEELRAAASILDVLKARNVPADRVVVEHNREIVPRKALAGSELHDGDRLEIVSFVGGG